MNSEGIPVFLLNSKLINNKEWEEYQELKEKNKKMEEGIIKTIEELTLLIDIGFDYDGYNNTESLKALIDELVAYAKTSRNVLRDSIGEKFSKEEAEKLYDEMTPRVRNYVYKLISAYDALKDGEK